MPPERGARPLVVLAPMAGISDMPFRAICAQLGADETTTEMVSAQGYLTAPKRSAAYRFLLDVSPDEPHVSLQLFGHDPVLMGEACRRVTALGIYAGIDINMGCPAQKVTGSGSGSALMKDLPLAGRVIRAVRAATGLPVSVKMRSGWDDSQRNAVALARIAQEEGADRLTIHGRTRMQQFAGRASLEDMAAVKAAVHIPVLANGDVFTARDALAVLAATGCDGVMIGRGALGNPFLFEQVQAALAGLPAAPPDARRVLRMALRHADDMLRWKGERSAVLEMRKHFSWYLRGMRGAAELRRAIHTTESLETVRALLTRRFEQETGPETAPDAAPSD